VLVRDIIYPYLIFPYAVTNTSTSVRSSRQVGGLLVGQLNYFEVAMFVIQGICFIGIIVTFWMTRYFRRLMRVVPPDLFIQLQYEEWHYDDLMIWLKQQPLVLLTTSISATHGNGVTSLPPPPPPPQQSSLPPIPSAYHHFSMNGLRSMSARSRATLTSAFDNPNETVETKGSSSGIEMAPPPAKEGKTIMLVQGTPVRHSPSNPSITDTVSQPMPITTTTGIGTIPTSTADDGTSDDAATSPKIRPTSLIANDGRPAMIPHDDATISTDPSETRNTNVESTPTDVP
jgi:hypothetical protein